MNAPDSKAPFEEPWQAQALATAMSLQDEGLISAGEWSQALGAAIRRAQANGDLDIGETYYLHVIDALETLLIEKRLIERSEVLLRKDEWEHAFRSTPHGAPVKLR